MHRCRAGSCSGRFPQLKAERDHGSAAPPAQAPVDNDCVGSRRHCRSLTIAVVKVLALAWDESRQLRSSSPGDDRYASGTDSRGQGLRQRRLQGACICTATPLLARRRRPSKLRRLLVSPTSRRPGTGRGGRSGLLHLPSGRSQRRFWFARKQVSLPVRALTTSGCFEAARAS